MKKLHKNFCGKLKTILRIENTNSDNIKSSDRKCKTSSSKGILEKINNFNNKITINSSITIFFRKHLKTMKIHENNETNNNKEKIRIKK